MKGWKRTLTIIAILIFAIAFIVTAFYAFVPDAKGTLDYHLGPLAQNVTASLSSAWIGLTASEFWTAYISPPINAFFIIGIIWVGISFFVLHPVWHGITGWFAGRHEVKLGAGTPTTSMREPQSIIVQESPTPTRTTPVVQQTTSTPTPTKTEEVKKEASA